MFFSASVLSCVGAAFTAFLLLNSMRLSLVQSIHVLYVLFGLENPNQIYNFFFQCVFFYVLPSVLACAGQHLYVVHFHVGHCQ